ncbi:hypothetical protein ACEPAG_2778 [Sanghuangporus baumii]
MAEQRFYKTPELDTLQVHTGQLLDSATNARVSHIYGNIYSRIGNPTVDVFEKRMAALADGVAAVAAASGHAAQFMAFSIIAGAGDNNLDSFNQLKVFSKFGIKVKFVANDKPESSVATIDDKAKSNLCRERWQSGKSIGSIKDDSYRSPSLLKEWLEKHSKVKWVQFPELKSHEYHEEAKRLLRPGLFGASNLANVGDAKTLVIHPASTTHQQLSEEEQASAGVTPDLIRAFVGIEHISDIIADFSHALDKAISGPNDQN